MSDKHVQMVINRLKISRRISKAWVAEKVMEENVERPALAVAVKAKGFSFSEVNLQKKLAEEFSDLDIWVIPFNGDFKPLAQAIKNAGERVV